MTTTIRCAHCGARNDDKGRAALLEASRGVLHSFENYTSQHKPESEWDEYDHMMFPLWAALRAAIDAAGGEGERDG
jgi:hypothetical protein